VFVAMTIRFVLMVNKQGQTRLAQYYLGDQKTSMDERCALEAEVIRKCLSRTDVQCSFYEYRGYKVVYRRYASLFFIVGVEGEDENELAILEFIHALVETLDRYFENVVRARARSRRARPS
jgi:AP-4 complex subunit sigma-1